MKVVQLFNHEERSFREFDVMNADHRDAWFMSIRYDAALFAVVEFASGITIAIIIWQATGLADVGTLYVFIDWMRRFFLPLRDLSAKYSVMQSSMASAERIFQLLDTQPAVVDREPSKVVRAARGRGRARDGRVRSRELRLPGRGLGARRRHVPGGAGREGRDRGRHRGRQDHDHQAAHAPLRSDPRPDPARRRRSARSAPVRSAPARGDGAPGRLPVQRDDRGEHRAGPSGGGPREHRSRGARRARRPLHRIAPAGLRHPGARARQQLLGRRAPAALLRAGARPRRRRARARRGHQLDRQRDRGPDPGGDARPAGRAGPRS